MQSDQKSVFKIYVFIGTKYGGVLGDCVNKEPVTAVEKDVVRIVEEEVKDCVDLFLYYRGFTGGGLVVTIINDNSFSIDVDDGGKKNLKELIGHLTRRISGLLDCHLVATPTIGHLLEKDLDR